MCSSNGGAQKKEKDRMKLTLPPKLVEMLVCSRTYFALKKFHSQLLTRLMPYSVETNRSRHLITRDFRGNSNIWRFYGAT